MRKVHDWGAYEPHSKGIAFPISEQRHSNVQGAACSMQQLLTSASAAESLSARVLFSCWVSSSMPCRLCGGRMGWWAGEKAQERARVLVCRKEAAWKGMACHSREANCVRRQGRGICALTCEGREKMDWKQRVV